MKKLLIGLFILLSLPSLSFANSTIALRCESEHEWVLGGVPRIITLEIDYNGNIMSGYFGREKYRTTKNSLIWFDGQENPRNTIPEYGSFEYMFNNLQLKNSGLGRDIELIVEGRDYLASFRNTAHCMRIR